MQIYIHRVNTSRTLETIPAEYGVEVDLRADGNTLYLNHEPFVGGEDFADYLKHFHHAGIILNIKEAGIEDRALQMCEQAGIKNYFLLDVEFPYIYRATRAGVKQIAMRYSEDESMETVLKYKGKADWVWIDTNTQLPLNPTVIQQLTGFKTCLVCPERWGRPEDIANYIAQLQQLNFMPDAVMTAAVFASQWKNATV